jgi:hypothetical protein
VRNWPLLGTGRFLFPFPAWFWRKKVARGARRLAASLAFMSEEHHRVRYFVVRELPRIAKPLTPASIEESLRLVQILDDLERNLTFVFRNGAKAVS